MMRPFWVVTEKKPYSDHRIGVGITAYSEADALEILDAAYGAACRVVSVEPIKDMRDLDQNHVIPNMGNWFVRGIWYPRGREYISK